MKTENMANLSRTFIIKESKEMGLRLAGKVRSKEKHLNCNLGKIATGLYKDGNERGE